MTNLINENILQRYLINSNEAIDLKLVKTAEDLEDEETSFHPDMSHQVFGDTEQIFGYAGLHIKLYYSACNLTTYLSHSYKDCVDSSKFEGVKPDDVIKPIAEHIPPNFFTNIDDFVTALDKDGNFKPFGDMMHRFTKEKEGEVRVFEVYSHDISPKGFEAYHERLQTFLLWFIDASSFIEPDEKWKFFMLYEKYLIDGNPQYAIVGYATVYEYYAYPQKIRPRISQMLILPPFQRIGLGAELLQVVYNYFTTDSKILDMTVEDPSENFQSLRDFVDCRNCMKLKSFSPSKLFDGYSDEMRKEAQDKLKLNKIQSRRVYEILRLRQTDRTNQEEYRLYRLAIKNRLNIHYKKEDNYLKKVKKFMTQEELIATGITSIEQRHEALDQLYKELEEVYDHIVDKLNLV